ncbi:IS110-like element ISMdi10 family transposase [Methylorubrum extorquens]
MAHYAAFDVSDKETAIHVLDEHGKLVWKGKRPSEPEALAEALRRHAPELVRVGLETGRLAPWLYHSLKELRVPVICLDARHARAATALQRNKTDARDAETLAQLVRVGWYREARVKGWAAHAVRHLIGARAQLVGMATDLSNQLRSLLRTFGRRVTGRAGGAFEARVREQIKDKPEMDAVAEPLLTAWRAIRDQIAVLDRRLIEAARDDATCRLLMSCPGVGVVVAASFAAAVEVPEHFRRSRSVGAYLGLTPRRRQSGESDHSTGVSKRGDKLLRSYLFEAAASLLIRVQRPSALKTWGVGLVQRLGFKRAAVAVARKLGVVLHAMWRANRPFEAWPSAVAAAA